MSLKLRLLLFILISSVVAASAVFLFMYGSPVSPNGIDTFCGYKGPLFESIQANLSRDHQLWLNKTRKAFQDEFPFSLLLNLTVNETTTIGNESHWTLDSVQCNGVIVSQQWILTSAKCVDHYLLLDESYAAIAFVNSADLTRELRLKPLQVIKHYDFSVNETTGLITNDIALIRIERIKFIELFGQGHYLCPLCTDESGPSGQVLTPWFQSNVDMPGNMTLYASELIPLEPQKCRDLYPIFSDSSICTTQATLKIDARLKVPQNGSPLIVESDFKMNLIGISSYFIERQDDSPLLVYTDISHYRSWIERVTS